ncbi:hypothetical protein [Cohnella mopanensis]|uniref:hypothetical protein n=1 Tax=Cohnella mopanensis TaxID=2911966 RepID=UPI001EF7E614|nr:hypothetical protein [Cohnella mopanensis]
MANDNELQSAKDLVRLLKNKENLTYDLFQKHPDYEAEVRKRIEALGYNYDEVANAEKAEAILDHLWEDILSILNQEDASRLMNEVAIGLVNSPLNRARVEQGKAIIINYGLLTFLNQSTKYKIAAHEPQHVTFCDRVDPSRLTTEIVNLFYAELVMNYREKNVPVGPLILLDNESELLRGDYLYVKELFIVSHELAHILLNHTERSHFAEFQADHLAYQIVREVLAKTREGLNGKFLLVTLTDLFIDMQHLSGTQISETHPPAVSRLLHITREFYGDELAEAMKKYLMNIDSEEYEKLLSLMPDYGCGTTVG